jgi:hypothetical protein
MVIIEATKPSASNIKRGRPTKSSSSSSSSAAGPAAELVSDELLVPKTKKVRKTANSNRSDCIYIYSNDERPLEFHVDVTTTTVEDFEQMISERTNLPVSDFFIEDPHNKKPMEESEKFLTYYNVMVGDTLYLIIVNKVYIGITL